ncbi:MAG: S8 family serine peptidase [Phycisphaerae bacterium]
MRSTMKLVLLTVVVLAPASAILGSDESAAPSRADPPARSAERSVSAYDAAEPQARVGAYVLEADAWGTRWVARELLVSFHASTDWAAGVPLLDKLGLSPIARYAEGVEIWHVRVKTDESTRAALQRVAADPAVAFVSLNLKYEHDNQLTVPNDPLFGAQWWLHNTGKADQIVPAELHTDDGPVTFFFDRDEGPGNFRGEAIYLDLDGSGTVSAADALLAGPAKPNGTRLIGFRSSERYEDANGNTRYDMGECVYDDADDNRLVTHDDVRLLACPAGFNAGSTVDSAAPDMDLGLPLRDFYGSPGTGSGLGIIDADIDAPQAWVTHTDCRAIIVGVLDSGTDQNHTDIDGNLWANPIDNLIDNSDGDNNGVRDDLYGANFDGVEVYHDADEDGEYDDGEAILVDVDQNEKVSAPDLVLNGVARPANDDPLARFLELPERREAHTEHVTRNGIFDAGEFVYNDADNSKTVTTGDRRLTAVTEGVDNYAAGTDVAGGDADQVAARLLVPFLFTDGERHNEFTPPPGGNGRMDADEEVYMDVDASASVTIGDIRITPVARGGGNPPYAAGSVVAAGDDEAGAGFGLIRFRSDELFVDDGTVNGFYENAERLIRELAASRDGLFTAGSDIRVRGGAANPANGTQLQPFGVLQLHSDANGNGLYDPGEWIVADCNKDRRISPAFSQPGLIRLPGDRRLTATFAGLNANTTVAANDTDVDVPLRFFRNFGARFERHDETATVNGLYDIGEGVYVDVDNDNVVSDGDIRVTSPAGGPAPGVVVDIPFVFTDPDVGNLLISFASNHPSGDITDLDGHGTAVAGCIGAEGNNGEHVSGVCWRANIMTLRSHSLTSASIIAAIDYVQRNRAAPHNRDIRIVNMSFGGVGYDSAMRAKMAAANDLYGVVFVVSAGNSGDSNDADGQVRDWVYRDADANNRVSVGDVRRSGSGLPSQGMTAGSMVAANDPDVNPPLLDPLALRPFLAQEKHRDTGANANQYDAGEHCYWDEDLSNTVTVGDTRLSFFIDGGTQYGRGLVMNGEPDIGRALVAFAADEKYVDRPARGVINGVFDGIAAAFPASYNLPNQLTVAASNNRDNLAEFSNFGITTAHIAAPGQGILTLNRNEDGGGVQFIDGTSFSAPIVAGILAHLWTLPGNVNVGKDLMISDYFLRDTNNPGGYQHVVEHRYGLRNTVIAGGANHDARARMASGEEIGDAPDAGTNYRTAVANAGARHEDCGEEWLGRDPALPPEWVYDLAGAIPPPPSDASPEFEAFNHAAWAPDPDGVQNLVDMDARDGGIQLLGPFIFSKLGAPRTAKLRVFINTEHNDVIDADGGRYASFLPGDPHGTSTHHASDGVHDPNANKHVWVSGFFDWNRNGDWDDAGECVFRLCANPAAWRDATFQPFGTRGGVYHLEFTMPNTPPGMPIGETWARFRVDYGENAGRQINFAGLVNVGPSPAGAVKYWDAAGGLPDGVQRANRWESYPAGIGLHPLDQSKGLARYGEVEDYRLTIAPYTPAGPVKYVDWTATGANDGSSWADAFTSLQTALLTAQASGGEVLELWVAQGTYTPGPAGDRNLTFALVNNVRVYGGFDGTEDFEFERDPAANPTILSGDLNGDDGANFANHGENCYHVVSAYGVSAATLLDGFTIRGGNADVASEGDNPLSSGGGVYLSSASPQIRGCILESNSAHYGGGAIYATNSLQPLLADCTIRNNRGTGGCGNCGGAGVYFENNTGGVIMNCTVQDNTLPQNVFGAGSGAGLFFRESSSPLVGNTLVRNNTGRGGGGVCVARFSNAVFQNCTVINNTASFHGGGFYIYIADPTIQNSIVWGNMAPNGAQVSLFACPSSPVIDYCDVQGGQAAVFVQTGGGCDLANWGGNNIDQNPELQPSGSIGNLSPCIDAGSDALRPPDAADLDDDSNVAEPVPFDIVYESRVLGTSVDMGAFEVEATTPGDCDPNCDGVTNNFDIDAFVFVLITGIDPPGCTLLNSDCNGDGVVNNFDIDPFVVCLTQGCP